MSNLNHKALLEFFLTDNTLYTFIIRPDVPSLNIKDESPIVLSIELSTETVQQVISKIRKDYEEINADKIQQFDYSLSDFYALGHKIFTDELYQYIKDFDALYIVPFGLLHYLPIHAFKINDHYIIDLFQVAYLPSASVLQYLTKNKIKQASRSILLGGVDSSGWHDHFHRETDQIAALPYWKESNKQNLKDNRCTKEQFFAHCDDKSVIHLSSHGYFNADDPLMSGLQLAGSYSEELIDGQGLTAEDLDYVLTAKDIFEKAKLSADLFVMSGCFTGQSENKPGDELIGLTRALIYAGAKTMIVSLFPAFKQMTANNQHSQVRFSGFYECWLSTDLSKGAAFQRYIRQIKTHERFKHPYWWFQFVMIGSFD